jgi:hypothetical protein
MSRYEQVGVTMLNQLQMQANYGQYASQEDPARVAISMYYGARARAWANKLASTVSGGSRRLLRLAEIAAGSAVRASHYAGIREVPLDLIRGSEGRVGGFDAEMWPTDGQGRDRWVSVAAARQGGVQLPPVELIQVGNAYFVRDGHHRISVARALGQAYIDARVTVWEVSSLADRKSTSSASELAPQLA